MTLDSNAVAIIAIVVSGVVTPFMSARLASAAAKREFRHQQLLRSDDHEHERSLRRDQYQHEWDLRQEDRNQERLAALYVDLLAALTRAVDEASFSTDALLLDQQRLDRAVDGIDAASDAIKAVRAQLVTYGSAEVLACIERVDQANLSAWAYTSTIKVEERKAVETAYKAVERFKKATGALERQINSDMRGMRSSRTER